MAEAGSADCETQRNEIAGLLKTQLKKGDTWYLIDTKWFKQWKKYVGYDSWDTSSVGDESANPGPIDNGPLFKEGTTDILKEHLIEELDYMLVPEPAWVKFTEWFGTVPDQKELSRQVIEQGMFVKHCKVEVYLMDLKLCDNSDLENLVTMQFSRADTIDAIEKEMRRTFNISEVKEVRLWNKYMSNTYEHLSKPDNTVQDAGLYQGQVIVIEQKGDDGSWPRQNKSSTSTMSSFSESSTSTRNSGSEINNYSSSPARNSYSYSYGGSSSSSSYYNYDYNSSRGSAAPGLCGLSNLGNTCFMNSALQCMSNVPQLTEYFLSDKWKEELNYDNPLGMKGEIATSYAELIRTIWSGRYSYTVPRNFKIAVGKFAPQFSGYQQQDSQELMAFLLDGLHEDLNRIKKKPYVELKDAEGRNDEVVAEEAWTSYLKRNDSVIVDTFHGLLKSTLVCPECKKVSVTFDPFCYLSLPLPIKKERHIEVFLVPLDPAKKPRQFKLTVPKMGHVSDLCRALSKLSKIPADRMVVTDVYNHRFHKVFAMEEGLNHILDKDDIFIYEVPINSVDDPETVIVPVYLREKRVRVGYNNYQQVTKQLFGQPLLVPVPRHNCTYEVLYNAVLDRMSRYVRRPTEEDGEWWVIKKDSNGDVDMEKDDGDSSAQANSSDEEQDEDAEEDAEQNNSEPRMFTFEIVNSYGSSMVDRVHDDGKPIKFSNRTYIALDWNMKAKKRFFDEKNAEDWEQDQSMNAKPVQKKQSIQLNECLDLFTTTEKLGQNDAWYCPQCKEHQLATKKFDLWSLPQVLVIHLKRFSYNRYWRDKLDVVVEYPTRGLNLKKFIINPQQGNAVYDLIGVSNHFGGLGGGHYTAFAKNKDDNHWHNFDDSSVSPTSEDAVVTRAGYVLVYQRRSHMAFDPPLTSPRHYSPDAHGAPDHEGNFNNGGYASADDDMDIN